MGTTIMVVPGTINGELIWSPFIVTWLEFLIFWVVFDQNLRIFGKKIPKKFAPIIFSSFLTTGENFIQNGDPHVTPSPPMVHSLTHPLISFTNEWENSFLSSALLR